METVDIVYLGIGIVSACFILIAFVQQTRGVWVGPTLGYELLNFLGACGLTVYDAFVGAYPNLVLNVIWSTVAIVSLWRLVSGRPPIHKKRKGH